MLRLLSMWLWFVDSFLVPCKIYCIFSISFSTSFINWILIFLKGFSNNFLGVMSYKKVLGAVFHRLVSFFVLRWFMGRVTMRFLSQTGKFEFLCWFSVRFPKQIQNFTIFQVNFKNFESAISNFTFFFWWNWGSLANYVIV